MLKLGKEVYFHRHSQLIPDRYWQIKEGYACLESIDSDGIATIISFLKPGDIAYCSLDSSYLIFGLCSGSIREIPSDTIGRYAEILLDMQRRDRELAGIKGIRSGYLRVIALVKFLALEYGCGKNSHFRFTHQQIAYTCSLGRVSVSRLLRLSINQGHLVQSGKVYCLA